MSIVAQTATLAHGFTMAEVDRIAQYASTTRHSGLLDPRDRKELAWLAIVELLYESKEPPTGRDLVHEARRAVSRAINDQHRHSGWGRNGQPAPSFEAYWRSVDCKDDFTDTIAERLALPQVLSQLTALEYEAIAALAGLGNNDAAAASLGISESAFRARIRTARKRIKALWFAPETPRDVRPQPNGVTCRYGHSLEIDGWISSSGRLRCRICQRNSQRRRRAKSA